MRLILPLVLVPLLASAQPKLLSDALKNFPNLTLLNPDRDLKAAPEYKTLKEMKYGSFDEADFDHDGTPDVAAVVVERKASSTRFGVIAALSSMPSENFWLVPLDTKPIYGVFVPPPNPQHPGPRDRIVPLACIGCDSNTWLRWSGKEFLFELYTSTDVLAIADQNILRVPTQTSPIAGKSGPCEQVKALDFRGSELTLRWYLIETVEAQPKRGWVSATVLQESEPGPPAKLCWWKQQ